MISKSFTVIGVLTLLSAAAHAGPAPKELFGKSVTVTWTETRSQRFQSEQQVRNVGVAMQMNIYISTAGRPFVRLNSSGMAGRNYHEQFRGTTTRTEQAPGEATTEHVDFDGRSIVVYQQFRSGTRRIDIDAKGTVCRATIVNGREGGKDIERKLDGGRRRSIIDTNRRRELLGPRGQCIRAMIYQTPTPRSSFR
jgi:hypothetical protein